MTRSALTPDEWRTIFWREVYLGEVTLQILDRAAIHSAVNILQLAHRTRSGGVPGRGRFAADPTGDDYRPDQ